MVVFQIAKHPEYDNDKLVIIWKVIEKRLESVYMVSKANVFINHDALSQILYQTISYYQKMSGKKGAAWYFFLPNLEHGLSIFLYRRISILQYTDCRSECQTQKRWYSIIAIPSESK